MELNHQGDVLQTRPDPVDTPNLIFTPHQKVTKIITVSVWK